MLVSLSAVFGLLENVLSIVDPHDSHMASNMGMKKCDLKN